MFLFALHAVSPHTFVHASIYSLDLALFMQCVIQFNVNKPLNKPLNNTPYTSILTSCNAMVTLFELHDALNVRGWPALRSWRWAKDCPKLVELILEINKLLLLHLVGFSVLLYLHWWCTVKHKSSSLLFLYCNSAYLLSFIQDTFHSSGRSELIHMVQRQPECVWRKFSVKKEIHSSGSWELEADR